jgi:integrase
VKLGLFDSNPLASLPPLKSTRIEQAEVEAGVARLSSGAKGLSFSLRSFHSLRHSFISTLANSGVSSELRRRLSGHASEEMHAVSDIRIHWN